MIRNYFWVIMNREHIIIKKIITGNKCRAVINIFVYFIWLKYFSKTFCIKFS